MTKFINAKNLRENLKSILSEVESGTEYIVVYRSKPMVQIKPIVEPKPPMNSEELEILLKKIHKHVQESNTVLPSTPAEDKEFLVKRLRKKYGM